MDEKLNRIEEKLDLLLSLIKNNKVKVKDEVKKTRELKQENLLLNELDNNLKFVENCLISKSIISDIKLIKKFYLDNEKPSIEKSGKNGIRYWLAGCWNNDILNEYTKTVLCKNLITTYLFVNSFERYENNMDQFMENQDYIKKLRTPKYQNMIIQQLIKSI
jgi:hypothetical protein